jgi:glucose/arabinose dehydrogenase
MRRARRLATTALVAAIVAGAAACTSNGGPEPTHEPRATAAPHASAPPGAAPTPAGTTGSTPGAATGPAGVPTGAAAGPTGVPTGATDVVTGLKAPWGVAFVPDGTALVTLRDDADVLEVSPDGHTTRVTGPGADQLHRTVVHDGEGGLLGVAVLAGAGGSADIALYATTATDDRVLKGTLTGSTLGALTPILTGIHQASIHNGGRLATGPDGDLYVSTGDAGDGTRAQDRTSLNGKILRITPDGHPAPGDPFPGSPVWSYGHRNVEGLGWSADGRMFASEFGLNTWDELNQIVEGGNYGWPTVEGMGNDPRFRNPLVEWHPDDASPSGLAVTPDAVYLAALRGERLWRVPLTQDGVGTPQALFTGSYGRLRTVVVTPTGDLWLVTNNTDGRGTPKKGGDRILRLTFG